jgi:hypothetical protein
MVNGVLMAARPVPDEETRRPFSCSGFRRVVVASGVVGFRSR